MTTIEPIVAAADAVDALRTYLRIECADDDPLLASLIASAIASCESFLGETLLVRGIVEAFHGDLFWTRLSAVPVVAVTAVELADETPLDIADYAIDIDPVGIGRVRLNAMSVKITPLAPVALRADIQSGGDVAISWIRRSRAGWGWADGVDAPLGEEQERYRATRVGAGTSDLSEARLLYAAAERESDWSMGLASVRFEIAQIGTARVSPASIIEVATS